MNTNNHLNLEKVVSAHTLWLSSQLELFASEKKLIGKLTNGCRSNENGLFVGWVSYAPNNDPGEEAIELLFTLSKNKNESVGKLDVGIYWSDGSVIQEISEFDNMPIESILSQTDIIIKQSKDHLLSEMKKEMSIDRQPYYRKD